MTTQKNIAIIAGGAQGSGPPCAECHAANGGKPVLLNTDQAVQNAIKQIEHNFGSITQMINSAGIDSSVVWSVQKHFRVRTY